MSAVNPPAYVQALSHPADVFRRAIQTVARGASGVFTAASDMLVTANGTPNMSVNVAAGRALIPGTQNTTTQGTYEALNDATVNLTIAASNPSLPRNDLVVASVQDAAYSGGTNLWLLQVITGTPASSPADPAVPANSITLARVRVDAAVSSIVSGKITDLRPTLAGTAQLAGQYVAAGGNNGGVGSFTAMSRFLGMLAAQGPPTSGTYLVGDWGFDSKGGQWFCSVAGTPGTWLYVGGGPYHAEVYLAAGQSCTSGGFVQLAYDTVEADPNSNFTTGASAKYTAPLAGRYQVSAAVNFSGGSGTTTGNNSATLAVFKNGSELKRFAHSDSAQWGFEGSVCVRVAAADTLDIRAFQNTGGSLNTSTSTGSLVYAQFEYLGS